MKLNNKKYIIIEIIPTAIHPDKGEIVQLSALKLIKKDGYIIYSTCSILKDENEKLLQKFIDKKQIEIIPLDLSNYNNLPTLKTTIEGTLCLYPDELYEGFFIAKIRKVI